MEWVKTSNKQQYAVRDGFFYVITNFGGKFLLTKTPEGQERILANTKGFRKISEAKEYAKTH